MRRGEVGEGEKDKNIDYYGKLLLGELCYYTEKMRSKGGIERGKY